MLIAAIAFALSDTESADPEKRAPEQNVARVAVVELQPTTAQDRIVTYGQVQARWRVNLKAEVSGRVLSVADEALVGAQVAEGTALVTIEDTAQQLDVANREAERVTAQRVVQEERQRARIAVENWRIAGFDDKPDPLVLRAPQLKEAEAKLHSAELALKRAQYMLSRTQITAPFDGAVTRRLISPGDYIQAGTDVVEMYDTSHLDVVLPATEDEIARLDRALGADVTLTSERTGQTWQGVVDRIGQQVDSKNRWINLIVSVSDPSGLVVGQFLKAEISGQSYSGVYRIPVSLIGRDNSVWQVDQRNRLRQVALKTLFTHDGASIVQPNPDWSRVLRLTPPSSLYLDGLRVNPMKPATGSGFDLSVNEVGQ